MNYVLSLYIGWYEIFINHFSSYFVWVSRKTLLQDNKLSLSTKKSHHNLWSCFIILKIPYVWHAQIGFHRCLGFKGGFTLGSRVQNTLQWTPTFGLKLGPNLREWFLYLPGGIFLELRPIRIWQESGVSQYRYFVFCFHIVESNPSVN